MHKDFLHVLSVEELVSLLLAIPALETVRTSLEGLPAGSVLAEPLAAPENLPCADRSGMDGYAVRAEDLFGASELNPVWLDCIGDISIDHPADFTLKRGECASIVTGGYLPAGADAIVMVEHTKKFGGQSVEIRRSAAPGGYVMRKGEDAAEGHSVLMRGTILRPQELSLLAALGITEIPVIRSPRVSILSTGDELVPPSAHPLSGQIRDSNTTALAAMIGRSADVTLNGIAPDRLEPLVAMLQDALTGSGNLPPDVLFLSGGSSIGVRDLTLEALRALGDTDILCHGVALSPGKPLILAQLGKTLIWGLPGQVTSAQVVMQVLGIPFLQHLSGGSLRAQLSPSPRYGNAFEQSFWPQRKAVLTRNIASRQGREDYVRVVLEYREEGPMATPVQGLSGLLRTLIQADGLIRIPAHLEGLEAGTPVDVLLF